MIRPSAPQPSSSSPRSACPERGDGRRPSSHPPPGATCPPDRPAGQALDLRSQLTPSPRLPFPTNVHYLSKPTPPPTCPSPPRASTTSSPSSNGSPSAPSPSPSGLTSLPFRSPSPPSDSRRPQPPPAVPRSLLCPRPSPLPPPPRRTSRVFWKKLLRAQDHPKIAPPRPTDPSPRLSASAAKT